MIWPLLRTRRWLAFTALVVFTIVAFGLLSNWQWNRAEERRQERVAMQAALDGDPTALAGITAIEGDEWRAVTATGSYLPDQQVVVRKRPLDARNGFWVMTPLQQDDGNVAWVNRGWLAAGADALTTPPVPAPPGGPVMVTGYLRGFEDADPAANEGLPAGQVAAPAPGLLPDVADSAPGYVQLATSQPEQDGLVPLPLPTVDESRNVSYAIQWLLFAAVAMSGWYFFLRREAHEDAERAAAAASSDLQGG